MTSLNCQNTNFKNKINFSANIEFCDLQVIKDKLANGINVRPWKPIKGKEIGTEGILMCNAGGITGRSDNNLVFHVFPTNFFSYNFSENFKYLETMFNKTISSLKQEKKEPQALIFGGDIKIDDSKDFLVILKSLFKKFKIEPSIFWGTGKVEEKTSYKQKNIFYDGNKDTWYVNLNNSGKNEIHREDILNSFEYIYVSPEDKVKFPDTGWISGKERSLNKGHIDLTIEDVLKKYKVDPKILESLSE